MSLLRIGINALENGWMPDAITRVAIRRLCRQRLIQSQVAAENPKDPSQTAFQSSLSEGPIAPLPEKANEQHYEVPPEFFELVLGPRKKYSCCFFSDSSSTLAGAEDESLAITCQRAQIEDGQRILELGCGWGSLSLWMAEKYPKCQITAVSNSSQQRKSIEIEADQKGLTNLRVVTADMNDFSASEESFDRVVSVEMFEHMRNLQQLFSRVSSWLKPDGKLFVHVFCHREFSYPFETQGAANWMGQYFFTGGMMPSAQLFRSFDSDLRVSEQHTWNGEHYQRTADCWLANMDANRESIMGIMKSTYGEGASRQWFNRWRVFFLAVSELFGYQRGEQWFVSHYLFEQSHENAARESFQDSPVLANDLY